jgi:hypothetical protein
LDSGFALNVGRLHGAALRALRAYPKISAATFPVERSGDFFIPVQEKEGKHVNRSCEGCVDPTCPAHLWRPAATTQLKGFTMKKILIAVLSLAIGTAALAQAPAPAAQTATASPDVAASAVAKKKAKRAAKKAAKKAKAASAA